MTGAWAEYLEIEDLRRSIARSAARPHFCSSQSKSARQGSTQTSRACRQDIRMAGNGQESAPGLDRDMQTQADISINW